MTEPHLEHPEADFARAHAAFNAGDTLSAMTRIDQALLAALDWSPRYSRKPSCCSVTTPMHRWRCWMTTSSRIPMPAGAARPSTGARRSQALSRSA